MLAHDKERAQSSSRLPTDEAHAAGMHSVSELLHAHGLRVTPQRLLLVEVAREMPGHFTAEAAYDRIQRTYPSVSVVSVYRGLETLRELGLVTRTNLGDHAEQYEWTAHLRHHHVICLACGSQQELPDAMMDGLRNEIVSQYGFRASIDHHAIFGVCASCSQGATT